MPVLLWSRQAIHRSKGRLAIRQPFVPFVAPQFNCIFPSMSAQRFPVGWFEIYVQDMPRAKSFYEATFQTTLTRLESAALEMWIFPKPKESPGCPGALVKMPGKDSGVGGTIIYFSCADCGIEAERAAKSGGAVQRPKFSIGEHGFIAFINDTEGNLVGLHSMK